VQPYSGKNRLPMKKSNVRFFHGEPVFSDEQPMLFPEGEKCINIQSHSFIIPHSSGATGATGASTVSSYARVYRWKKFGFLCRRLKENVYICIEKEYKKN
jgi:hypothetical protein